MHELAQTIESNAPNANAKWDKDLEIELGGSKLVCSVEFPFFENTDPFQSWDVLAGAFIGVHVGWSSSDLGRPSRSANVWFCRLPGDDSYRWWEVGYHTGAKSPDSVRTDYLDRPKWEPFGVSAVESYRYDFGHHSFDYFHYGWFDLAYNPKAIDGEYLEEFCARWAEWLAKAVGGQLYRLPMPEEKIEPRFDVGF